MAARIDILPVDIRPAPRILDQTPISAGSHLDMRGHYYLSSVVPRPPRKLRGERSSGDRPDRVPALGGVTDIVGDGLDLIQVEAAKFNNQMVLVSECIQRVPWSNVRASGRR